MDYGKQIEKAILYGEGGDIDALVDAFEMIRKLEREDLITVLGRGGEDDTLIYDEGNFNSAHSLVKRVRVAAAQFVRDGTGGAEMLELYRRCLLFDAPHFFDEYCRYIEFDREPEKKFYEPRRKQLLPIVNALQELADDKLDLLAVSLPPGVGKALANDTPIFTRNGWKNHGDLQIGDEVIGLNGEFKKVLFVHKGAPDQYSHNENSVNRTFRHSDMLDYVRNNVIPYAAVR